MLYVILSSLSIILSLSSANNHVYVASSKYILVPSTPTTWYDAQSACTQLFGTSLASITSKEDKANIDELLSTETVDRDVQNLWIGLNNGLKIVNGHDGWRWIDGAQCEDTIDCSTFWDIPPQDTPSVEADCGIYTKTWNENVPQWLIHEVSCPVFENINGFICNVNPCNVPIVNGTECVESSECSDGTKCGHSVLGEYQYLDADTKCNEYCSCYCLDEQNMASLNPIDIEQPNIGILDVANSDKDRLSDHTLKVLMTNLWIVIALAFLSSFVVCCYCYKKQKKMKEDHQYVVTEIEDDENEENLNRSEDEPFASSGNERV